MTSSGNEKQYDVCLSFAGEQRSYVERVAAELRQNGTRVFYDDYERAELWGKDLYEHLDWVYRKAARFCVVFISADYANKVWTNHERKSAQARALEENGEYVLPVRFDDAELPGVRPTVGYLDAGIISASEVAALVQKKLGPRELSEFLPPRLDKLYKAFNATKRSEKERISEVAVAFFNFLRRMTREERRVIGCIFLIGCPAELPKNVHVSLDLVRRYTGHAPVQTLEILKNMRSLGFSYKERADPNEGDDLVVLTWRDRSVYEDAGTFHFAAKYSTAVAHEMLRAALGELCDDHANGLLDRLDFSHLSKSTST